MFGAHACEISGHGWVKRSTGFRDGRFRGRSQQIRRTDAGMIAKRSLLRLRKREPLSVSYTHLDVYKRQIEERANSRFDEL